MQQRERRAGSRREAARASDHNKSQAAGDPESCVRGHTETHQAHQGAAFAGDRTQHESHPGNEKKRRKNGRNEMEPKVYLGATLGLAIPHDLCAPIIGQRSSHRFHRQELHLYTNPQQALMDTNKQQ